MKLGKLLITVSGSFGGGGPEDVNPARLDMHDWDERFRKWERDRWKLLDALCYRCAVQKYPELAHGFLQELRERQKRSAGPVGMTGAMNCDECGGWRTWTNVTDDGVLR